MTEQLSSQFKADVAHSLPCSISGGDNAVHYKSSSGAANEPPPNIQSVFVCSLTEFSCWACWELQRRLLFSAVTHDYPEKNPRKPDWSLEGQEEYLKPQAIEESQSAFEQGREGMCGAFHCQVVKHEKERKEPSSRYFHYSAAIKTY